MTKTNYFALLMLLVGFMANAQERIVLEENLNGFEIAYQIQLLEADAKKGKDEYQIIGYITNKSGTDLYSRGTSPYHLEVTNANSLTKAAKPACKNSQYVALDMTAIYMIPNGATIQDQAKVKVPSGSKPVVNYRAEGQFVTGENIAVGINAQLVNGTWRSASGVTFALNLPIGGTAVVQQAPGASLKWFQGAARNVLVREFVGALFNGAVVDPTAFYRATITFTGMNKATYVNSEGISLELTKD